MSNKIAISIVLLFLFTLAPYSNTATQTDGLENIIQSLDNSIKNKASGGRSPPNSTTPFEIPNMGYGFSAMIQEWDDTTLHGSWFDEDRIVVLHQGTGNITMTEINRTTLLRVDVGTGLELDSSNPWYWTPSHH